MGLPYNTMRKGPHYAVDRSALAPREVGEGPGGFVFRHDLAAPLSAERRARIVRDCRCLYAEVPWRAGWEGFHARAGVAPAMDYSAFLTRVLDVVKTLALPSYLVGSKELARESGAAPLRIILNGDRAWLYAFNGQPEGAFPDTDALLSALSTRYASVYDPCCGYGNALRHFKTFVGSDIDGKCVDYCYRALCHRRFPPP